MNTITCMLFEYVFDMHICEMEQSEYIIEKMWYNTI